MLQQLNMQITVTTVHAAEGITKDRVLILYFDTNHSKINKNPQYMSTAITRGRL